MSPLRNNLQIVLQTEKNDGTYHCEGFADIPVLNPCLIVLYGTKRCAKEVLKLRAEIIHQILRLGPQAKQHSVPCPGTVQSFNECHAHKESYCQKVLVIVNDDKHAIQLNKHDLYKWLGGDSSYHIIPVFPSGSNPASLLPSELQHLNAAFWSNSIAEVVPAIFSLAGLSYMDSRIFISYRRKDCNELAQQLFDELSHHGFDVFLDRFSVPPGIDFQIRLTQELVDKSLVLVLESEHINQSQWTIYEINFAKSHRLGLLGLHLPKGVYRPDIDMDNRIEVNTGEYDGKLLSTPKLGEIVNRIKQENIRMIQLRRQYLRDALRDALLLRRIFDQNVDTSGLLHIKTPDEFAIWLTTRPPELADFHNVDTRKKSAETGVVIGPSKYLESDRRIRLNWLSSISNIYNYDEGELVQFVNSL